MGNQMYQIATTIATALRNDAEYVFRKRFNGGDPLYFSHFPEYDPEQHHIQGIIKERAHEYHPIQFKPDHQLHGYWQSEKYYIDFRKEILEAFGWEWELKTGIVSLHIRRGDFVLYQHAFPLCTMEYYDKAIAYFTERGYRKFLVFSDDIDWCKANLKQDVEFEYSEGLRAVEDCKLMSCCEHHIVANSSFSVWGAWMNRNPDKIVVAPSMYNQFGARVPLKTHDLVPESWIQIRF
jgi:hypothetical protein